MVDLKEIDVTELKSIINDLIDVVMAFQPEDGAHIVSRAKLAEMAKASGNKGWLKAATSGPSNRVFWMKDSKVIEQTHGTLMRYIR